MNNKNKRMIVIILVLVIALITLSVAFAALSATLKINFGNVNQTVQTWNVGFDTTGSPKAATASGSSATGRTCGAATITATTVTIANTELSKPDDACRWDLVIKNSGTINAKITGITATKPTGTGVSCTGSGAQIVCGNITYTLAKNTGGSTLLSTSDTIPATTGNTLNVYLIAKYTSNTPAAEAITQQNASFKITVGQN